ncbi:cardiolipin synthase [Paenibacillus marinisediminis]
MRRALQVALFIILLFSFGVYLNGTFGKSITWVVSLMTTLGVISLILIIFMENRHPSSTAAWILVLALVPVVGFIFYLLFGQNYRKRRNFHQKAQRDRHSYGFIDSRVLNEHHMLSGLSLEQRQMLKLTQRMSKSPVTFATHTEVLTNGEETFSALIRELRRAKHHIHMEYYIYRDDDIGRQIKSILMEKARAGVQVRFMFDAVGSIYLKKSFLNEMRQAGIQVVAFGPMKFRIFTNRMNYRNHRKIVIIDGDVGFIGGLNVGDEYLSRSKTYGFWRDTHMIVRGEAVQTLQMIFLQDWRHMTKEELYDSRYFVVSSPIKESAGAVQIIASGPDQQFQTMKNVFFSMLTSARRSIWMATPYFIPDEDILTAMKVAALSGIEVKLLFPAKPDKWLPFLASHSYFQGLIEAGVKIYEYEKGFLHSKLVIVDGEIATIGTTNLDMRSFYLNFEVNALLVQTKSVDQLVRDFERDLQSTKRIREEHFLHRRIVMRFLESVARLFSPLL